MTDLRNVAVVSSLPRCDFCGAEAHYDFQTHRGSWAYGCDQHWVEWRATIRLGLGVGQLLVTEADLDPGRLFAEGEV